MAKKKKQVVSRIKIRIDSSDDSHSDIQLMLPHEVVDQFLSRLVDWRNNSYATYNIMLDYQKEESKFFEKLKEKE